MALFQPGLPGGLKLEELLDIPALQALLGGYCRLTGAVVAILDLQGRVLW